MSRHWDPGDELARVHGTRARPRWPEGATVGVVMVAAACVGMAVLLYRLAGPRDIFGG